MRTVDARGAQSLATPEATFRVRALVLFSLGPIDIGWFEVFLVAVVLFFAVMSWLLYRELRRRTMRGAYSTIIGRDVVKFSDMLEEELTEIKKEVATPGEIYRLDKALDVVTRMKKYLGQEVGKIKK